MKRRRRREELGLAPRRRAVPDAFPGAVPYFGRNAVKALVAARPGDVRALRFEPSVRDELEPAIAALRARDVAAESATREELDALAGSLHHESVVAIAAAPPILSMQELLDRTGARGTYLVLDRITNPYNLGAIVRTAAYFGTDGIVFAEEDEQAKLTPGAVRVAEGGVEHVALARARNLTTALLDLKKRGVKLVGTDAQAEHSLFTTRLSRPVAVVLGSEREGLLPAHRTRCDVIVSIPGTTKLDSLNVSVAAGIVLAEMARLPR